MPHMAAADSSEWPQACAMQGAVCSLVEILDPNVKSSPAFAAEYWSTFNSWNCKDRPSAPTILQEMSAGRQEHTDY